MSGLKLKKGVKTFKNVINSSTDILDFLKQQIYGFWTLKLHSHRLTVLTTFLSSRKEPNFAYMSGNQ